MKIKVKFLGAAGCVTGSKFLVSFEDKNILIDAGMFQGKKELRERNWQDPAVDLSKIDAVLLTHAHIDHVGILPRYVALGLNCPIYCTPPTEDLLHILLPDAAYLQEEEAEYRNRKKKTSHGIALPLYTKADVARTLPLVQPVDFNYEFELFPSVSFSYRRSGHIIGAGNITLKIGEKLLTFSGDIGRYEVPVLKDPQPAEFGDLLLVESTYGDRLHPPGDQRDKLEEIINRTTKRGGAVIIPSFAVGRAQTLLYLIRNLKVAGKIDADLPVIIDSPMATDATEVYRKHPSEYDEEAFEIKNSSDCVFSCPNLVLIKDVAASKKLNKVEKPMIIISASGMLYGGRILHHLKNRIEDAKNTVLFVGYQPPGSRGQRILSGAKTIRLLGYERKIAADIERISGFSAHGDAQEMLDWCRSSSGKPKKVMIVHGEPESAQSFAEKLKSELNWNDIEVAEYKQTIEI